MSNIGINALLELRQKIELEKYAYLKEIDNKLADVDGALAILCGGKESVPTEIIYDDENPDQVKQSIEEI